MALVALADKGVGASAQPRHRACEAPRSADAVVRQVVRQVARQVVRHEEPAGAPLFEGVHAVAGGGAGRGGAPNPTSRGARAARGGATAPTAVCASTAEPLTP